MKAAYLDIECDRGSRLIVEFQIINNSGNPVNITNDTFTVIIKESNNTDDILYEALVTKTDNITGFITLAICAEDMEFNYPVVIYSIFKNLANDCFREKIITGNIILK